MNATIEGDFDASNGLGLTTAMRWCAIVVLGGLLVFAAIAKMLTGQWVQTGTGVFELFVVAVLVIKRRSALSWLGLSCLFGAFLGYTFSGWISGASSCGCFGNFEVRPAVTMWIDTAGIVIAGLTSVLHAKRSSMLGAVVSSAFCCAAGGMVVATVFSPPPPSHYLSDEEAQLLTSESYSMLAQVGGPAWYVYLYDRTCPLCRVHLPRMQRLEAASSSSNDFRVITIDIFTLDQEDGIAFWSWGSTPIMLEIAEGRIIKRQQGHDFLDPDSVSASYVDSQDALGDPLARLEVLDIFSPVLETTTDAWLVLILSERTCNTAREQVSLFRSMVGPNETLGVHIFETADLEVLGISRDVWGSDCTGVLYRAGERIAQYSGADIPDPFTLWTQLQAGMVLPAE